MRNIIFRIKFARYISNANYFEEAGVEEIVDVIADENNINNIKQGKPSGVSCTPRFQLQTFCSAEQSQQPSSTDGVWDSDSI